MKLQFILDWIRKIDDPQSLSHIARAASDRYLQLINDSKHASRSFSVGDVVSFSLSNGRQLHGIIEGESKKNLKVLAENGTIYRVPRAYAKKESTAPIKAKLRPVARVERVLPLVLSESERLLNDSGLRLPVRYKRRVWSTHFRPNRHIQYGERCLAYQLTPVRATDNVGANLRRFKLPADIPGRLAMLVCHEVSHAIAHKRYGPNIPPHGRQFFVVLSELVDSEFADIRQKFQKLLS